MKIKDVEKLTGLTAKSIRFYESKGLLEVQRNEENDYREYTEENVKQLRKIKLFRYLDFSIEELQQMQQSSVDEVKKALLEKADMYSGKVEVCETKRDICLGLSKDYGKESGDVVEEYHDVIDFVEGEEFQELWDDMNRWNCPSNGEMAVSTIVFLGPIIGFLVNINMQRYEALELSLFLTIIATIFLTLKWKDFLHKRKYRKSLVEERNQQTQFVIPILLLAIIFAILALVGTSYLQIKYLAPDGWLFFEMDPRLLLLSIATIMLPIISVLAWSANFLDKSGKWENGKYAFDWLEILINHKRITGVCWIICVYICFISVTFVTENQIVCYSPFNPMGTVYEYSDVEKVDARFGEKIFSLFEFERKGSFSYTIWLDGKKEIFTGCSVNEDIPRYEDTYLELEEFDQALMKLGIPKEGDSTEKDNCVMDQCYIDRFVRIIENGQH